MTLGVFGPIQIIVILFFVILIPGVVLIIVFSSRAKHKSKAETLDTVRKDTRKMSDSKYDQLEKLNKLRESGALTDEEFEAEKKKILG
ncbi:MAG: hypothetical protein Crog4KO_21330 [Crocinitomicaceae bacterium]